MFTGISSSTIAFFQGENCQPELEITTKRAFRSVSTVISRRRNKLKLTESNKDKTY